MKERRNAIVEMVNAQGSVSFSQLKAAFPEVSEMTLRMDLKALDEQHLLVRIHGGAKSIQVAVGTDDLLGRRTQRNAEEKALIAQKALGLLHNNMSFYLDSGSSGTALARVLPDAPYLIYTNSLSCALELARLDQAEIFMPGGALNRYSLSLCGSESLRALENVNFDLLFLGVTGYSAETGFSCGVCEENRLKQLVLRRAEKVAVLMDSSKLGLKSTFTTCGLGEVDMILSDGHLPEDFLEECRQKGVAVY